MKLKYVKTKCANICRVKVSRANIGLVKHLATLKWVVIVFLVVVTNVSHAESMAKETSKTLDKVFDKTTGLIIDNNWKIVAGHCSACHSLSLVKSNRANRQGWLSMIRWMQETQNLWQFDLATEEKILTYLAKNYGPDKASRRRNLPPHLLPPKTPR